MSKQLALGDTFPQLKLNIAGGNTFTLPDDISTDYAVVLFYRGHW
jgi:peroxiredoxin